MYLGQMMSMLQSVFNATPNFPTHAGLNKIGLSYDIKF